MSDDPGTPDAVGKSLGSLASPQHLGGVGVTDPAEEAGLSKGTVHSHSATPARKGHAVSDDGPHRRRPRRDDEENRS
ncbi:hypothetical protein ACFPYI_07275 [Halomarina salina]|uniref:ArsR family transcriptional regulator n=1 Tax=Halomarina salina TaxID=1872699 RepID=A0ABD5RL64_9EURY|nr:hypothetical protein [Halomarina salina]